MTVVLLGFLYGPVNGATGEDCESEYQGDAEEKVILHASSP